MFKVVVVLSYFVATQAFLFPPPAAGGGGCGCAPPAPPACAPAPACPAPPPAPVCPSAPACGGGGSYAAPSYSAPVFSGQQYQTYAPQAPLLQGQSGPGGYIKAPSGPIGGFAPQPLPSLNLPTGSVQGGSYNAAPQQQFVPQQQQQFIQQQPQQQFVPQQQQQFIQQQPASSLGPAPQPGPAPQQAYQPEPQQQPILQSGPSPQQQQQQITIEETHIQPEAEQVGIEQPEIVPQQQQQTQKTSEDNAYEDVGDNPGQGETKEPYPEVQRNGYNKKKALAAPTADAIVDPKCNSELLRQIIHENIHEKTSVSKRQIQSKAAIDVGGKIDVICSTGVFSYIVNTELYCESEKNGITCLVFRQAA